MPIGEKKNEEIRKAGQGKWKRMARSESKNEGYKYEQNKENVRSCGIKRDWQQGDDE